MQLQLLAAHLAAARHGQRLERSERQRAPALDVELFVEAAQLALDGAGTGGQSRGGALGHTQGNGGERQAAQQVVPVAVRGQQAAGRWKAGLLEQGRQRVELIWQDRRVDHERLGVQTSALTLTRRPRRRRYGGFILIDTATDDHAVRLQQCARDHEHVRMQRDGPHAGGWAPDPRQVMPSSLAASLRLCTSAVGFFWEGSRVSLLRLTQMTGTRCFRHGTTSW